MLGTTAAAQAADATAAAIRTLVESGTHAALHVHRLSGLAGSLRHLYYERGYAPLWLQDNKLTVQAQAVVGILAVAADEGLDPDDYDAPRIVADAQGLRAATPTDAAALARFDVDLSAATMRYIEDVSHGVIDPQRAGIAVTRVAAPLNVEQVITEAATADATAALHAVTPPFPVYQTLKGALAHLRQTAQPNVPGIPALPRLHPGGTDTGIPALRQFLIAEGDLPADTAPGADLNLYDDALVKAVTHFQHRHGLEEDGIIGAATLRQLRAPLSQRIIQLRLALERLRWLPHAFPKRTIIVNLPEFRMRVYDRGGTQPVLTMNVVVGSVAQNTETPLLAADMRYVIFRPRWNVPDSITQKEMLPSIRHNARYIKKENLELVDSDGMLLEPTEENIDLLQTHGARLRQKPGDHNSLGLIKFVLPNRDDIYFHDTPRKSLFRRARRDFSHGCIRVADPVALAEFALTGVPGWTRDRIEGAMHNTDPDKVHVRAALAAPISVYLLYTTAVVGEDGEIVFLDDIYGYDAKLAPLLTGEPGLKTGTGTQPGEKM